MRIERKILTRKQILLGRYSAQFWVLAAFLALVFLIGGGSRNDIQSLVILRPASILVFAFGLWTLSREHLNAYRWVFGMAAAIMILTALHLVPLPPAMWEALSGRGLLVEIDHAAGIGGVWRPLAMVPTGAWNAFFSLFAPLSVLVLGVQLDADERFRFLPLLLGIGLLSGSIGLLQILGAPDGPLYFYRVTNEGSAVGLFANRNHAAVFLACLFPLLAIFGWVNAETIERRRFRSWMSGILGGFILMLILVTGSRAGVVVAALGLVSVPLLYQPPQITLPARRKGAPRTKFTFIYGAFGIVALGVLTALFSRAEALKRLTAPDQLDDRRFQIWGPTLDAIWKYFPFGSGVGSFPEVFAIEEPDQMLLPSYANHAHNDWLEVLMTLGMPGMLLLLACVFALGRRSLAVWRNREGEARDIAISRAGSLIFLFLAIASIGDYPLRTPSIICFAVVAILWLTSPTAVERTSLSRGERHGVSGFSGLASAGDTKDQ